MDKDIQYRECIKRLDEKVGKEMLSVRDVADFCGIDPRTVKKRFTIQGGYIALCVLAHEMVYGVKRRVLR